jgi:hypothetical protein
MLQAAGSQQADVERDPQEVLGRFGEQHDADCVVGDTISLFVDFIVQHLVRIAPVHETSLPSLPGPAADEARSKVYVYHKQEDSEYAYDIAKMLHLRDIEPLLPAFDGNRAAQIRLQRQYLRDCDGVVICWAAAPEVWAKAKAHELSDWSALGRNRVFKRRGLVAGPPPGVPKKRFVDVFPRNEIDVVVDLTAREHPKPEDLDPLIPGR